MRVIQLNRCLLRKLIPVSVVPQKSPDEIGQRAGDQKVLLHETQSLPNRGGIVRVEYASEGFRFESGAERTDEIARAEFPEIEIVRRGRCPEPESIDGLASVAHYGTVERNSKQRRWATRHDLECAVAQLEGAVQPDLHLLLRPGNFPRIRIAEPVVRIFLL